MRIMYERMASDRPCHVTRKRGTFNLCLQTKIGVLGERPSSVYVFPLCDAFKRNRIDGE